MTERVMGACHKRLGQADRSWQTNRRNPPGKKKPKPTYYCFGCEIFPHHKAVGHRKDTLGGKSVTSNYEPVGECCSCGSFSSGLIKTGGWAVMLAARETGGALGKHDAIFEYRRSTVALQRRPKRKRYRCHPPLIMNEGLVMARARMVSHPGRAEANVQMVGHPPC